MIDGFSRYNQVVVHDDNKDKTSFTTPWGTFMYDKMPFGLTNASATFHRATNIAFVGEKDKFIVVYLDVIKIFSQSDVELLNHLKKTFQKCRIIGQSLNPKKSLFAMEEGRLVGDILHHKVQRLTMLEQKQFKKFACLEIGRKFSHSQVRSIFSGDLFLISLRQ